MVETVIIRLAMIAGACLLIYLGVKTYGDLKKRAGRQDEHEEGHVANDAARKRFDWASRRPLSGIPSEVAARMRARAERMGLLKPRSGD